MWITIFSSSKLVRNSAAEISSLCSGRKNYLLYSKKYVRNAAAVFARKLLCGRKSQMWRQDISHI
jgi:hypothetical protein